MKKYLLPIVGLLLALALTACGTAQNTSTPKLEANGSVQECVDTACSPIADCGIHTVVDKAAGTVTFTKTDKNGKDTVEYLKFTPAKNEVEKYYYVSMMGTGFYYYYDLSQDTMVRVEDKDHKDVTESSKSNNRFDKAAEEMKTEVTALQDYFKTYFGESVADAAAGK